MMSDGLATVRRASWRNLLNCCPGVAHKISDVAARKYWQKMAKYWDSTKRWKAARPARHCRCPGRYALGGERF
jgi:hypothetical protein